MSKPNHNHQSHPPGLYILFFTEMWERFSFYGLRALLVLYLTQELLFSDDKAYDLFGAYTAMVYVTPVIGGYIADRWLGFRHAITLGGVLIMLGHLTLALPGHQLFYYGLAFVVCGTGFLKSSISSVVGELYDRYDTRRDSGFTIFYMGINLGALLAGVSVGVVAHVYGWHYGFALAGVGMMLGLSTFLMGQHHLQQSGLPPIEADIHSKYLGLSVLVWICVAAFLAVPIIAELLHYTHVVGGLLATVTLISLLLVLRLATQSDHKQRNHLIVLLVLMIFSIAFFALFEQAGSSMTLFTERSINRELFGWLVPTPAFQSLNPLFILILAPLFAMLWVRLSEVKCEPSTPMKFAIGLVFVALGFGVLSFAASLGAGAAMMWVVLAYYLHTVGELCLSPVGLSAVTKLAPPGHVGMLMGMWFLAAAFSNYVAAMIAKLTSVAASQVDTALHYSQVFGEIFGVGLMIGLLALLISPYLKRLMV